MTAVIVFCNNFHFQSNISCHHEVIKRYTEEQQVIRIEWNHQMAKTN